MSWPLTIATLGTRLPSGSKGGTRCIRTDPGPSGFRVVCDTWVNEVRIYSRIFFVPFFILSDSVRMMMRGAAPDMPARRPP